MQNPARRVALRDRFAGILLFLPVPLALLLLTRLPLGPLWSPVLAMAVVLSHRLYARPFALARARRRCLWCGGPVATAGLPQAVHEPGGETMWMTCDQDHSRRLATFFAWLQRYRQPIRIGVLGSLLLYLALSLPGWLGYPTPWSPPDIAAAFQGGIAITVLPVGWLATSRKRYLGESTPRVPFPVHIQALIGSLAVVWLFRLVGLAWLAMALWHFTGATLSRLGA